MLAACEGGTAGVAQTPDETPAGCDSGLSECADACVDTRFDPSHCGACGKACADGEVCSAGACAVSCGGATTKCGSACVDTDYDPAHCGACDVACSEGEVCADGNCQSKCQPGTTLCGALCVDTQSSPEHCGACDQVCAAGQVCFKGACSTHCGDGLTKCGNLCVDVASDPGHCQSCDNACPGGANASPVCQQAACGLDCNTGFGNCNQDGGDGCEIDVTATTDHCGACDAACAPVVNGAAACQASSCVIGSCTMGFGDCDMLLASGCESNFNSDVANCGMCGNVCPVGMPTCTGGVCSQIDLTGLFAQYTKENRNVYIFKTSKCADLTSHTNYCQNRGLAWWKPKSQADAQELVTFAYDLDNWHTWVQVHGVTTQLGGTIGGYSVTVDSSNCVGASSNGFAAFRKWACSFCNPVDQSNKSCCWDTSHSYDWFVCEG
jgi:hypothetical protein